MRPSPKIMSEANEALRAGKAGRPSAEAIIRQSEERLKVLFEFAPDAYYLNDLKGRFLDGNRAAEEITGYKREELIGQSFLKLRLLPRDQVLKAASLLAKNALGMATGPDELTLVRKDGVRKTVEIRTYPVKIEGKTVVLGIARDITERRQAEKTIQESQEKFKVLAEHSPNMIFILQGSRIIYANKKCEETMGYKREELFSPENDFLALVAPESRELIRSELDPEQKGQDIPPRKLTLLTEKGERREAILSAKLINLTTGRAVLAVVTDITELNKIQRDLWREKNFSETLINSLPGIFYLFDDKGRLLRGNRNVQEVTGFTGEEIARMGPLDFFGGENKRIAADTISRVLSDGQASVELEISAKNGQKIPFYMTGIRFVADNQVYILGMGIDISFTKKAEEERKLLSAAVENLAEIILITTNDGLIQYVNPAFERVMGFRPDEICGRPFNFLTAPGEAALFESIRKILLHGDAWTGRFSGARKNGSLAELEATISALSHSDGTISNIVFVMRDVSQEIIREKQLRQVQKMEALGTLAGGVAHDFNNILTSIIGYTEIALDDVPRESALQNHLREVLTAGNRGRDLVKKILAFSRQSELEKKPVQVSLIIKETTSLLRSSTPANIEIHQYLNSASAVLSDPTQIQQIIMNLCSNSVDAMRANGGILEIKLEDVYLDFRFLREHPEVLSRTCLKLTVSDTGEGVEKSLMERIFDPFFTTKPQGKGTGMGLAIVQSIVHNLGGTITAESVPGEGTTFAVFLPRVQEAAKEEVVGKDTAPPGNERILVIDDEPPVANMEKKILERLGYEVAASTNPLEALQTFQAKPDQYDLVVTDMTMPEMMGDELARKLLGIRPDISIILCTGFSERISEDRAKALGIKELIMKPILKNDFATAVRRALDKSISGE
jgi:PAS domain S-box-containing protein